MGSLWARRAALLAWALAAAAGAQAAPTLSAVSGRAAVLQSGNKVWQAAGRGAALAAGDRVRTAVGARATVTFDDGSRVDLEPGSTLTVEEAAAAQVSLQLALGSLRAWVEKNLSRRFAVRTPTATVAVRGTVFAVKVDARGRTTVEVVSGSVSVTDQKGHETWLLERGTMRVSREGMPESFAQKGWPRRSSRDRRFSWGLPPGFLSEDAALPEWHTPARDVQFWVTEVSGPESRRWNGSAEAAARDLLRRDPGAPRGPDESAKSYRKVLANGLVFHHVIRELGGSWMSFEQGGRRSEQRSESQGLDVTGYFELDGKLYRGHGSLPKDADVAIHYSILGTIRSEDPAAPSREPQAGPAPAAHDQPVPLLR